MSLPIKSRRKGKGVHENISRLEKDQIDFKRLDDLESDVLEGLISSNESISDFEDENDEKDKDLKRKRKQKKPKKDKRTTLTKSKVNLKQMISDMERKPAGRGINYISIASRLNSKPPPIRLCAICNKQGVYQCTRCLDRYCGATCLRHHKEFICSFMEYNYYF